MVEGAGLCQAAIVVRESAPKAVESKAHLPVGRDKGRSPVRCSPAMRATADGSCPWRGKSPSR